MRVAAVTVSVTGPFLLSEAGDNINQPALSLALQLKVPLPVLLMLRVWAMGSSPPCWAVKDRLAGLVPIAGMTKITGDEGGEVNCVNPGISAANLLIVRPPPKTIPEVDELLAPAAARGRVPICAVPAAMDFVIVVDGVARLMVARGMPAPRLLLSDDGCLD